MGLLSRESFEEPRASGVADGIEYEETFPDVAAPPPPAPVPTAAPVVAVAPPRLTVVRPEPLADEELTPAPAAPAPAVTRADRMTDTQLVDRIEAMLSEWQARFEARLEQRRVEDERIAERRRRTEDERMRAWRIELEQQLLQRLGAQRDPSPARAASLASAPGTSAPRMSAPRTSAPRVSAPASLGMAIASAASVRDVGRLMRDYLSQLATTCAFALSLHHRDRSEVAYRYRVASEDDLGAVLRRDTLDDGPASAPAQLDGWARAHRAVRVGEHSALVHTAQCAVRVEDATIGILTLQTEGEPLSDGVLASIADVVAIAAPRISELRDTGAFRGA